MTKKQYRSRNVTVGTVKKSIAAIASRWLLKKASQLFAGSEAALQSGNASDKAISANSCGSRLAAHVLLLPRAKRSSGRLFGLVNEQTPSQNHLRSLMSSIQVEV